MGTPPFLWNAAAPPRFTRGKWAAAIWNGGKNVTEIERKKKRERMKFTTISVISLCAFFGIWYIATAVLHLMPDYCLPSPVQVVEAFIDKLGHRAPDGGTLFEHIAASLKVALSGYVLGAVIGIPLGICMAWFRRVDLFVTPLFDLVRPVPTIAWIPLMILWFGIGLGPRRPLSLYLHSFPALSIPMRELSRQNRCTSGWPRRLEPPGQRCSLPWPFPRPCP